VREVSLVAFTLLTQAAVGTCWSLLAVQLRASRTGAPEAAEGGAGAVLLVASLAAIAGLAAAFLHLGRPSNAWRALRNLRSSWLSREILFASAFTAALGASALLSLREGSSPFWTGFAEGLAAAFGLALLSTMAWAYRLRTVPAWDRWTTAAAFFASALGLGALTTASVLVVHGGAQAVHGAAMGRLVLAALLFHLLGLAATLLWLRRLRGGDRAARESLRRVVERRPLVAARFALSALVLVSGIAALASPGWAWPAIAACLLAFGAEAAGRSLFYAARVRSGL
jgi:anaerobic dimethyl sulfoxide reductase subunit C (anchor subunit)